MSLRKVIPLWVSVCFCIQVAAQDGRAYSSFDFVPGEKVIYFNNFETDVRGELPAGWNTTGSAEVVFMQDKKRVKLLQNAIFITDNIASFSENFTVEFDLLLDFRLQDALFPAFSFGVLGTGQLQPASNRVLEQILQMSLAAIDLNAGLEQNSFTRLICFDKGTEYFNSGEKPFKPLEQMLAKPVHVSIQVQQPRLRVWLNESKLFDVPMALPAGMRANQLFFRVFESSYTNDQIGIYVSDIKVAAGEPDTRNRLLRDGKFSTTGILFDVNSARIKPESNGIIREIAEVLRANPDIRILITGHTDADGNAADNELLSRQRSESVRQMLVNEYTIAATRIQTDGKGESQPVAANTTKEGKAQNRRVEFLKL